MKRTNLRPVSAKRKTENSIRKETRNVVLERSRGRCEAQIANVCTNTGSDLHEILTRARGGSIVDPENILFVCRPCHTFITDNPDFSDRWGFTVHNWGPSLVEAQHRRNLYHRGN